ncbi:Baculoviral IAP repeat-containing protein [Zostera marina]|uniref:Baculoviral IAP repeat-containing protein n=1 Tax=Zostera marina TaxID=29655 RepID=A0A0K9PJW6_ZOSMR|nr:Baculoviral IAP repeat-containing protein [Zostera marina]
MWNGTSRGRWSSVGRSFMGFAAHSLLLSFTIGLSFKLNRTLSFCSWWLIFIPLWLFHAFTARGRFSIPAPSVPMDRHWAPLHALLAMPLLLSFELLLCIFLQTLSVRGIPAVSLKIVFLPLLLFQLVILIDNFRMCMVLTEEDEDMGEDTTFENLPHLWILISMTFLILATMLTLFKLCGDFGRLSWWYLFLVFGIAQCFAFLVCTKWTNPMIHRKSLNLQPGSSSMPITYRDWNSGLMISVEDKSQYQLCTLEDIGGHIIKIPIIAFQILLFMHLEGTPLSARNISTHLLFMPLFLLQGVGVLFAVSRLVEKVVLLLCNGSLSGKYLQISSRCHDFFAFLHHGSRLLGWWSIDEGSKEEQARLLYARTTGYNTFCGYPPEIVQKMPKKDLTEEIWRLQAALGEQAKISKYSRSEYERLNNEKVLCRVCFESEIHVVLLPCKHRILCKSCAKNCKICHICSVSVEERMDIYDA